MFPLFPLVTIGKSSAANDLVAYRLSDLPGVGLEADVRTLFN
jgi:hypothetical protein